MENKNTKNKNVKKIAVKFDGTLHLRIEDECGTMFIRPDEELTMRNDVEIPKEIIDWLKNL